MQNTDQTDSPPSLNPKNQPESKPENQSQEVRPETPQPEDRRINEFPHAPRSENQPENEPEARTESDSDVPFTDEQEEAQFVEVHGGPSGRLQSPEEAAVDRAKALDEVKYQVGMALQEFRKVTKQSHTVDRLLGSLTPTASMSERLPFTPSMSLHLESRNRDDHILHLAGLIIETWGILSRGDMAEIDGKEGLDNLTGLVTRLGDVVRDRRQFKPYPVDPRSSFYVLRRITEQVELNRAEESQANERASRLSNFPRRTD